MLLESRSDDERLEGFVTMLRLANAPSTRQRERWLSRLDGAKLVLVARPGESATRVRVTEPPYYTELSV